MNEPARTDLPFDVPRLGKRDVPALYDRGSEGLVVYLGAREGRAWSLVVDGSEGRSQELGARAREDILFLAGECAGLLFSRDLADHAKS